MAQQQYIWFDGKFVNYEDCKVHILTHSLHYGSASFEGLRCYNTKKGPAIFRLSDHIKRFMHSMQIYGMPCKYTQSQIESAIIATVKKNGLKEAYIRPLLYYNTIGIGYSTHGRSTSLALIAVPFGGLFPGHSGGLNTKVSSWHRINSSVLPVEAKMAGNYLNSILANKEAKDSGYDEAILLSANGMLSEGPGENIFLVQDGVLVTPPKSANILLGITRDSVIKMAKSMGIPVEERDIRREELYISSEAFFSGTGAELTPILSVDKRLVGNGKTGAITTMLMDRYYKVLHGEDREFSAWLTRIR